MRQWVVQIRHKGRKEFPETFLLQATDHHAKDLEEWIRAMHEAGAIKDFLFQPVQPTDYQKLGKFLASIDTRR